MPVISVLVPAYNRADTLVQCVDSALRNSSVDDLEVIISDNASTDGTADVADAIARHDARVTVLRHTEGRPPLANWKACLERATAPLTHWLWSDDFVDPTFYRDLLDGMRRHDAQMAICAARIFDPQEGWSYIVGSHPNVPRTSADFLRLALHGNLTVVSPAAALLPTEACRRNFADAIPRWPGIDCNRRAIGCDALMILGAALASRHVYTHPEPLAHFRHHATSISSSAALRILPTHYAHARLWWSRRNRIPRRLNALDYARLVYHGKPLLALRNLF